MRIDDPWYDVLASGRRERCDGPATSGPEPSGTGADAPAAGRLAAHHGTAFREARRRRRSALPTAAVLLWCLVCPVAVAVAPDLLGRPPVDGPLTVGLLVGIAQLPVALLAARAYTRPVRPERDGTTLEPRRCVRDPGRPRRGRQRGTGR